MPPKLPSRVPEKTPPPPVPNAEPPGASLLASAYGLEVQPHCDIVEDPVLHNLLDCKSVLVPRGHTVHEAALLSVQNTANRWFSFYRQFYEPFDLQKYEIEILYRATVTLSGVQMSYRGHTEKYLAAQRHDRESKVWRFPVQTLLE